MGSLIQRTTLVKTAQTTVATDSKNVGTAQLKLAGLERSEKETRAKLAELKKNPGENAAGIAELEEDLRSLTKQVGNARAELGDARAKLESDEGNALSLAKAANEQAVQQKAPMPFADATFVDSVADAASLPAWRQRALLGAETQYTPAQAQAFDVAKLGMAAANDKDPSAGAEMLDNVLRSTAPDQQAGLLKAAAGHVDAMAIKAVKSQAGADAFLDATKAASPEARKLLADSLAKAMGTDTMRLGQLYTKMRDQLKNGDGFGFAMDFSQALDRAGLKKDAATVNGIAAESIRGLRKDFDKAFAEVAKVKGELAALNSGFGPMLSKKGQTDAINSFTERHAEQLNAGDAAARKLTGALTALGAADQLDVSKGAQDPISESDNRLLKSEALELVKELPKVGSLQPGKEAIAAALAPQKEGGAAVWLDGAVNIAKTSKELTENVAKAVTAGIGQLALRGDIGTKLQLAAVLTRHRGLLGLEPEAIKNLGDAFADLDGSPAAMARAKKAFEGIEGGHFGKTPAAITAVKSIGLALSMYGVAKNALSSEQVETGEKFKQLVEQAKLGTEGATFAMELLDNPAAMKTFSKLGGALGVVGGLADALSGISAIRDGQTLKGTGDLLSGAGGALMGLASVSAEFPGGQAPGALLAIAGFGVKAFSGLRESAAQHEAMTADAQWYLVAGGVPLQAAGPLGELRNDDLSNLGTTVGQLAPRLRTSPEKLYAALMKLPPEGLRDFTRMAKDLGANPPADPAGPTDQVDRDYRAINNDRKGISYHPKSLTTAAIFTRELFAKNDVEL